ncbi:MAG: UbiA family prenyltransferase [Candidatus Hodarchaeales archaeon]
MTKTWDYLKIVRPQNIFLGVLLVFTGAAVGSGILVLSVSILLALISISFAAAGAIALNSYSDIEIDKIAHPARPLPSKRISPEKMLYFGVGMFAIAIAVALFVNISYLILTLLGVILFVLYETLIKKYGLVGNLLVAGVVPLACVAGGYIVNNPYPSYFLLILLFPQIFGGEIIRDVRDQQGDKLQRITLPSQIGEKPALFVGLSIIFITIFISPLPYLLQISGIWYLLGIVVTDILIIIGVLLSVKDYNNLILTTKITKTAISVSIFSFLIGIF